MLGHTIIAHRFKEIKLRKLPMMWSAVFLLLCIDKSLKICYNVRVTQVNIFHFGEILLVKGVFFLCLYPKWI